MIYIIYRSPSYDGVYAALVAYKSFVQQIQQSNYQKLYDKLVMLNSQNLQDKEAFQQLKQSQQQQQQQQQNINSDEQVIKIFSIDYHSSVILNSLLGKQQENQIIIFLDYTPSLQDLIALNSQVKKIIIIDTHTTQLSENDNKDLKDFERMTLESIKKEKLLLIQDRKMCCATQTLQLCNTVLDFQKLFDPKIYQMLVKIIDYIEDNELQLKKYKDSRNMYLGLNQRIKSQSYDINNKIFEQLISFSSYQYLLNLGNRRQQEDYIQIKTALSEINTYTVNIDNRVKCYGTILPDITSKDIIGQKLAKISQKDFEQNLGFIIYQQDNKWICQIQSNQYLQSQINCLEIAKQFNGHGHYQIANFYVNINQVEAWVKSVGDNDNYQKFLFNLDAVQNSSLFNIIQEKQIQYESQNQKQQLYDNEKKSWKIVEQDLNAYEHIVCLCMVKLGMQNYLYNNVQCCGDELYIQELQPKIKNFMKLALSLVQQQQKTQSKDQKKKKGKDDKNKKPKKKHQENQIIKRFLLEKVKNKMEVVIEGKIIQFLQQIYDILQKEEISQSLAFEIIYMIQKIKLSYQNIQGDSLMDSNEKMDISETCINDLDTILQYLELKYVYSHQELLCKHPQHLINTKYDKQFENLDIKPYKSQIEFIQAVEKGILNYDDISTLILFKSMIGSGKTTCALALAKLIEEYRQKTGKQYQLLFCSQQLQVRLQIQKNAYNKQISFGKIIQYFDGSLRLIKNNQFKDVQNPVMLVTTPIIALKWLSNNQKNDFILFFDEPTIDIDNEKCPIAKCLCCMMSVAPRIMILASSTLPNMDEIPNFLNLFSKNREREIIQIYSREFQICLKVQTYDRKQFIPHQYCDSQATLNTFLTNLKQNPFILRFYNGQIIDSICKKLEENGVNEYPSLNDIEQFTQSSISEYILQLFTEIAKLPDETIKNVLHFSQNSQKKSQEEETKSTEQDELKLMNEDNSEIEIEQILNNIGTLNAHKFQNGCIIAIKDPIKCAFNYFKPLIGDLNIFNQTISNYNKNKTLEQQQIEYIEKQQQTQLKNQENQKLIQDYLDDKQQIQQNSQNLEIQNVYKINSQRHYDKYAFQYQKKKVIQAQISDQDFIDSLDIDNKVPQYIQFLPFLSVGLFTKIQSEEYNQQMLDFAMKKHLAFLISDESICYGANIPSENLIIDDELAADKSINTIIQLMGRVGRVGQSWKGVIYIGNLTLNKIQKLLYEKPVCIEAIQLEKLSQISVKVLLNQIQQELM